MKKIVAFIMLIILALFITYKSTFNNEAIDKTKSRKIASVDQYESKIQYYLNKYIQLEKELKNSLGEQYSGTTKDIIEAARIEYRSWDNFMDEVYNILHEQLSEEDMQNVKNKQLDWLTMMYSKVKESAREIEDEIMEAVVYITGLVQVIKERCYDLITNYMK